MNVPHGVSEADFKRDAIRHYFKDWRDSVTRASALAADLMHWREGRLLLATYIGALSRERFPNIDYDREAYCRLVLQYSDLEQLYRSVDLLFFYLWPHSGYIRRKYRYEQLRNYPRIRAILEKHVGDADRVRESDNRTRYPQPDDLIALVNAHADFELDLQNLRDNLPNFSVCEVLYVFARCEAVHAFGFPLANEWVRSDGTSGFQEWHIITGDLMRQTLENIIGRLQTECEAAMKLPHQLDD